MRSRKINVKRRNGHDCFNRQCVADNAHKPKRDISPLSAQIFRGNEAFQVGDFFWTADQQALPMLYRSHELSGLQERVVSASVEPRITASKLDELQLFEAQIVPVYIADLEFTPGRRAQGGCYFEHGVVIKIESGDRPVGQELAGLLDNISGLVGIVEFEHGVTVGLADMMSEYGRALHSPGGFGEFGAQPVPVEQIIAENKRDAVRANELTPKNESMSKADGLILRQIIEPDAPCRPIAEKPLIERQMLGCRYQQQVADSGQHENRQRIINHRFIVDRHQLFVDGQRRRVKPGAGAAREYDALHVTLRCVRRQSTVSARARRQGRVASPKACWTAVQSSRLSAGRDARLGYCALGIGTSSANRESRPAAVSRMALANSNHVAAPAPA